MSDEILARVEAKLDRVSEKQTDMNDTLIRQQGILNEHMRRTGLAEEGISIIRKEMEPLKAHVAAWGGAGKVLVVVSVVVGIAFTVWKLLGH